MAGMSSDSELTSNTARHHRPYSSQSRVYHAHPAPRSSHASSRMSHYSDSATAYVPSEQTVSIKTLPAKSNHVILPNQLERQQHQHIQQQQQQQQQQQLLLTNQAQQQPIMPLQEHQAHNPINSPNPYSHKHYKQHPHQNVPHQTSITSSGSGGSVSSSSSSAAAAYLALAGETPISSMLQQQQGANFIRPASGRQFGSSTTTSQRPFKQSMSIDHHSIGQYHHLHHQSPLSHPISHHQNHATQSMSSHFEPSDYHQQQNYAQTSAVLAPNQRAALVNPQGSQILSHDTRFIPQQQQQQQRNLRHEMELIEKQTGNINLYDNTANTGSLPPTASRLSSGRQLPQNPELGVVDQQQQQPAQHQQKHHQADLFASHQRMSSPADWLPPMGITTHHLNRTSGGQFKQAMSIDHYTASASQQQQQHYSPARIPHLSEQYPPLGYPSSQIGGYESPTHSAHLSGYKLANSDPHAQSENIVYQYMQEQQPDHYGSSQQLMRNQQQDLQNPHDINLQQQQQQQQHLHSSTPNFGQISSKGASSSASNQQQQQRPNLQHQVSSSSSSNSQSGSLRSSNLDINKTLIDHQKSGPPPTHYQQSPQHKGGIYDQQHRSHGMLRKGHTSVMSGYGVNTGFSESGDLSSSQSTAGTSGGVHLTSHGGGKRSVLRAASPSVTLEATTSSGGSSHQNHHSSSSRDAVAGGGGACGTRSESSTGIPNGPNNNSSLTKKSNSATQLSMTGTKKRLGFRKKQVTSFSVHRSEEVAPLEARHLVKQGSSVSEGESSMSGDSSSRSWSNSNFKPQTSEELASMSFIDGLGKGQMISRQGLASPYLGDIQLSLCDRRGNLEVEVIRARNLQAKTNKILPLTYVKLYLVKNRKCLAKAKTTLSNKRTLDPLFQQQLTFHEDYHGCILQSIIWGNFGKMDKKNFMGIAQISIDDLELSDTVISWYKLFLPSSLQTLPSKSLRHTLLSNSTESFTNTNNS